MTFASDNLTVMVVVNPQRDGKVRLDGWAAPGGRLHAELRVGDSTMTAECDESGRFVFDAVPAGPAQLVLHPTLDSDPSLTLPVVTPAVHLLRRPAVRFRGRCTDGGAKAGQGPVEHVPGAGQADPEAARHLEHRFPASPGLRGRQAVGRTPRRRDRASVPRGRRCLPASRKA